MTITASTPRPVGDTGLTLTALGIGTAPLGGLYADVPREQALATLECAWDLGIRYFDTAPMYGLIPAPSISSGTCCARRTTATRSRPRLAG